MIIAADIHGEFVVFEDETWETFQYRRNTRQKLDVYNFIFVLELPVRFKGLGGVISKHMKVHKNRLPFDLDTSQFHNVNPAHLTPEMKKRVGQFNIERHSGT